jgi:hypothetical protein
LDDTNGDREMLGAAWSSAALTEALIEI